MWNSIVVTVAAGTAVRLAKIRTPALRLRITPLIGAGAGVVYVLSQYGDPGVDGAQNKTNNNFVAELAPASATVPGTVFSIDRLTQGQTIDVADYAVDGAHTGDTVLVSWEID